ncbi:MAG: hypothetical protein IPK16_22030 [Anaerolineales bacterium]|nr:hypothetical protein [Anaerolineales bacterium]
MLNNLVEQKAELAMFFFPLGDNPNQWLNLDEEPSLTVKMKDFLFMPNRAGFQEWGTQFFWNFNLVPADIPIQAIEKLAVALCSAKRQRQL